MIPFEPLLLKSAGGIQRALTIKDQKWSVVGPHSPSSFAFLIANQQFIPKNQPQLVVFATQAEADSFAEALHFFDSTLKCHQLPPFDVSVYSSLYPNPRTIANRLKWLHHALTDSSGDIFIATAEALTQQTLPFDIFSKHSMKFTKGDELPGDLPIKLNQMGYTSVPTVEDPGTYSMRGGIVDIFSPAQELPIRLELVGDQIDTMRSFDPETQRSGEERDGFYIIPAKECLFSEEDLQSVVQRFSDSCEGRDLVSDDIQEVKRAMSLQQHFYGMDFLLPIFYKNLSSPLEFFGDFPLVWLFNSLDIYHEHDSFIAQQKTDFASSENQLIRPDFEKLFLKISDWPWPNPKDILPVDKINIEGSGNEVRESVEFKSFSLTEFTKMAQALAGQTDQLASLLTDKFSQWLATDYKIFCSAHSQSAAQRLSVLLERAGFHPRKLDENDYRWHTHLEELEHSPKNIPIIVRRLPEGFRLPEENIIFITDADIWGARRSRRQSRGDKDFMDKAQALAFGDLNPGDFIVHRLHGIGIYDGLQLMDIDGVPSEFIQLRYKDNDKLYLPIYRVGQLQKYSGPSSKALIDKLGGPGWSKVTSKVKKQVRDIAAQLLKLYARRAQVTRPPFSELDEDYHKFEDLFPYDETDDQLRAINDVLADFKKQTPMDRLICGDVGFGKTEVALRASFKAVQDGHQVVVVAPTTILTFQHTETFKRRFKNWPIEIRTLNRFVSAKEAKKTLSDLREGKVDILIGTHRLLSKDVEFNKLGLLIIDEEQKFGVAHKERIRQFREAIDTLVLSATPIPRTLNMSLVGIRDISVINTPPEDRLPTRTFVCKFDGETIKKAVTSEIQRGGQVFFLHNRIQSIHELSSKLRELLPGVRMAVAHGQMPEHELEKTMLKFFNHELDILICTAIIESGMDIPRANTIFIDNAHTFGVSQLYQLRGRVGRSKERAYCYLIVPSEKRLDKLAQDRLRIIQENTALGSGIKVAHYDLELRGGGDLLGAEQSGHINAVGYEMYLQLLDDAIREQKGEESQPDLVDPDINLRISAFIPDKYMPDIRMRLSYYKALSNIKDIEDLDRIEDELRDQFGQLPDSVMNLMGLMLIRKLCRDLGVKDVSAGKAWLNLAFTDTTPLPPAEVIRLTAMENKKYSLAPDQRLKIRMSEITWPRVHDELEFLLKLCPKKIQAKIQA